MTEPTDTPTKRVCFTSVVAILAFGIAAVSLAFNMSPALRDALPWNRVAPVTVDLDPLEKNIDALNGRMGSIEQKIENTAAPVAAALPDDLQERLKQLEEHTVSNAAAMTATNEKLQATSRLPAALALVRVEERFERGQDYVSALDVLQKINPLDEADKNALTAADGVPTSDALIAALNQQERSLRRDERLALAQNPLERIWAELRSLVLIKTVGAVDNDAVGQSIEGMSKALRLNDRTSFDAAWDALPESSRVHLADWHENAVHRLDAHAVIERMIAETLAS